MNRPVKLILYLVCILGVIVLGRITLRSYREANTASVQRTERLNRAPVENTNLTEITNVIAEAGATNAVSTNLAVTNLASAKKEGDTADDTAEVAGLSTRGYSRMVSYGLGWLVFAIGLAGLIAYDVSQFLANKAEQALFTDDGAPADPAYDQAEELWKDGKYLDALNSMRAYLKKHPREQYVALRIAEVYEENLNNPLAAALEYEEVLKKKLPAERWGWAAIHLANLYSGKLNQSEKSIALLRRIDSEYGKTSAANKARERLTQIDPNFIPAATAAAVAAAAEAPGEADPASLPPPPSNLPPGFRPK